MTTVASDSDHRAGESGAKRGTIEAIERLVPIQFGILYGCLADPSKTVYLGQWHGVLEGDLDVPALERAWRSVVARHSILRTAFDWQLKAEPLQIVLREVAAPVELVDLGALGAAEQDARVAAFLAADRARGFDLARPPLMRLAVLRLAPRRHTLVWTRHHLVCDGWSLAELFGELFASYQACRAGASIDLPPAVPYARYVKWLNARDLAADKRFWADRLAVFEAEFPASEATGGTTRDFGEQIQVIQADRLAALRAACRAQRVTLNTLVQGAWGLVLARHHGRDDVMFGATETIRPDDDDGSGRCLGPQINTLPVAVRTWSNAPVGDWLRALQASAVAGRRHGKISLPEIAAGCGARRGQALFDSVLVFQNYPLQSAALPPELGLALSAVEDVSIPDLPLNLIIEPGECLLCRLIHDRGAFGEEQARDLLRSLEGALGALADAGDAALRSIDIRPDLRPAAVASGLHPADDGETVLHRIAAAPDTAVALVQADREITYGELRRRAHNIARALLREVGSGKRIGLLCRPSLESIVALLAIQWSGGAYVPFDPTTPRGRLTSMIADAGLAAVLVDPAIDAAPLLEGESLPILPFARLDAAPETDDPLPEPAPDTLAYVIFTSGSTGRPKGVLVPHRTLRAIIEARQAIFPEPIGGALLTFPLFFDGSVTVMFATLARGARLVLPDPSPVLDPAALCRTIARAGVTHTLMVPSLHGALLEAAAPGQLASLTTCSVAGEACEGRLVRRHLADLPAAALVNEYGPTEATVWASSHRCVAADAETGPPIGRAIDGVHIHLLDAHLRPVPTAAPGEIFIGGRGVAWGYVGNPALTAEKFLPDPWSAEPGATMYRTGDRAIRRADGNLLFLGRSDHQIKLRGYRIEPGEIEAVLCAEPGIAEAVVLVRGTSETGERLVAYVTGQPGGPVRSAIALQSAVAAKLPAYMVPTVVVLPAFPRLPSGKLDRRSLPEPAEELQDHGPPPEPGDEEALAALWREVLGLSRLSATSNFFDLGGTSLLGMRLVAQVRARLGGQIELYDLFRHPTVRSLAPLIAGARRGPTRSAGPIVRRARQRVAGAPGTDG
jgi:amino acid adenylation domain-containing protein